MFHLGKKLLRSLFPRASRASRPAIRRVQVFSAATRDIPLLSGNRFRTILLIALLTSSLVGITLFSGIFTVTQIRVARSSFDIPVAAIEQATREQALGSNILFIRTASLAQHITSLSPDFSHTIVRRSFPHTLSIEVFKFPLFASLSIQGTTIVLSENGHPVLGATATPDLLPLLLGEDIDLTQTEKALIPPETLLIMRDTKNYAEALLPLPVSAITYFPIAREAHLRLSSGTALWIDLTKDFRHQLDTLIEASDNLSKPLADYRYLDLRIQGKIFAMP